MKHGAILLAAGRGTRYCGLKQDEFFHGKPLWRYPYDALASALGTDNLIAVGKDIPGGETRAESVFNGLKALNPETDRVIIAEAARPMLKAEQVLQLMNDSHPSVSFVRPFVNAVIFRDGRYINRNELYESLAPQAFDYKLLFQAHSSEKYKDSLEDTELMFKFHGIKPHFIETEANLFKVTYPGDMEIIEVIHRSIYVNAN